MECRLQWRGSWGYSAIALTRKFLSYSIRARHYAALLGNWTSVDPLWPSEMAYGYVENRVMTGVDYWGTMNAGLVGFMLSHPSDCENRISDVITRLSGNGSPWTCGTIRLCIGQYLDPLNETGCGQHGGGHGFSGAIGAGCCVQVEIDLCALFALQSKKYGLPKIPECLVNLIKEFYNGINPIADCMEPFKRGSFECPPGYVVIVDPFSMVPGCVSSRYVMPQ